VDQTTQRATQAERRAGRTLSPQMEGMLFGGIGVLAFSLTMPATRAAAPELGGVFVGLGRSVVAALLAAILLFCLREPLPARRHRRGLALVALGAIVGFPLLSAIAMQSLPSAHGAVATGLLPAATAVMGVLRAGERPSKLFWLGCIVGVLAVLIFAMTEGAGRPQLGDLLLLAAVALGALGYAEGGRLAREMNGWRVICWALVLVAPVLAVPLFLTILRHGVHASPHAWLGFAYVSVVSAFLGFFAWYRGLAVGGVARVGQIQLVQPVLTLLWAALLIGEPLRLPSILASLILIGVAFCTQRLRNPGRTG